MVMYSWETCMEMFVGLHREKVKAVPAVVIQLTAYINRKMIIHVYITRIYQRILVILNCNAEAGSLSPNNCQNSQASKVPWTICCYPDRGSKQNTLHPVTPWFMQSQGKSKLVKRWAQVKMSKSRCNLYTEQLWGKQLWANSWAGGVGKLRPQIWKTRSLQGQRAAGVPQQGHQRWVWPFDGTAPFICTQAQKYLMQDVFFCHKMYCRLAAGNGSAVRLCDSQPC